MSHNRSLVNDYDIVRPAQFLDKGLPILGLASHYTVEEGWRAVITEGGRWRETLDPGTYSLDRYSMWHDVKATLVDVRSQSLLVSTAREFAIAQPVAIKINLDLSVDYRVVDPRRVALEVKTPLTNLFDRVLEAVRSIVSYATYDEIQKNGEGIAAATLQRLQAMQLPKVLGIEVLGVHVTRIEATDAGADALAQQQMREYGTLRDWQLDAMMTQQSQVSWEWLLRHRPEIAQQLLATHGELAKELINRGMLDPSALLSRPVGSSGQVDPAGLLGALGIGSMLLGASGSTHRPALSAGGQSPPAADIHTRVREEIALLEKLPGARVEARAGTDRHGVPDGSYDLRVTLPRTSGGQITLYLTCLARYPQAPPALSVEVDGQELPFDSAIVRAWSGQYLVEIAREVKQRCG